MACNKFRSALKKQSAEFGIRVHPAKSSSIHLKPFVCGAVILVNHLEFLRQAEKAFRVANEQIATGVKTMPKLFNQSLLLGFVKINHHVTAENDVIAAWQEFRF